MLLATHTDSYDELTRAEKFAQKSMKIASSVSLPSPAPTVCFGQNACFYCEGPKRRQGGGVNGSRYKIFAEAEVRPISQVRTTNPLPLEQARLAMEQLATSQSPRNSTRKTAKAYGDKTAKTARYTEHRLNRRDHKITRRFNWCSRAGS